MAKYLVKAKIEVNGIVEKHDIIGAIFGQTEGLFGEQFDLRTLQDKGRVGRIIVNTKVQGGKTIGEILIPSNLDRVETALMIAMIENVEKVGPYDAKITLVDIIDVRLEKIKRIVERASEILQKWSREKVPDIKEILKTLQEKVKIPEPISYGPENLPAGPGIDKSKKIILVEGRADVINMLRYGYDNVVALGGARKVPETIKELSKKKEILVLLDGDHAGDLILKEVLRNIKVDYIARAPPGKEVEELTHKELEEVLKKAVPTKEYLENLIKQGVKEAQILLQIQEKLHRETRERIEKPLVEKYEIEETIMIPKKIIEDIKSLYGTLEAHIYDNEWKTLKRIPVRDLVTFLDTVEPGKVYAIILDGIITQRLVDKATDKKIKMLIGAKIGKLIYKPPDILILTYNDVF
ncbi:MAG: DNA primase [Desulfurococcales archaeon ex4484_58]|nr:MAG: DNA primase [Desulfurococcales archaeon ex4484_58]